MIINYRDTRATSVPQRVRHTLAIFVLMLITLLPATRIQAQNEVTVNVVPKAVTFPAATLAYRNEPTKYFQISVTNNTGTEQSIYLTLNLESNMTSGEAFWLRTKAGKPSRQPIILRSHETYVFDSREKFDDHFRGGRMETNVDESQVLRYLTLPEGNYSLCAQAYRWTDAQSANQSVSPEGCFQFNICYSASAPELVTPIAGALLQDDGSTRIDPVRIVNFRWTPVITNCTGSARKFTYTLKAVKVQEHQNVNDAINQNPTIFLVRQEQSTFCQLDTVRDVKVTMERGATYAVQVQAVEMATGPSIGNPLIIANGGKSQVVTFTWGEASYDVDTTHRDDSQDTLGNDVQGVNTNNDIEDVMKTIRQHYIVNPVRDDDALTDLVTEHPDEANVAPKAQSDNHTDTAADGIIALDTTKAFVPTWMPVRGDSVCKVKYAVHLYEFVDGIEMSKRRPALKDKVIIGDMGRLYPLTNQTPVTLDDTTWGSVMRAGVRYYLEVEAMVAFHYKEYKTTTTTHYVNGIEADTETDTVATVKSNAIAYRSGIVFQWGSDLSVADKVSPPQFTYPIDQLTAEATDTAYLHRVYFARDTVLVKGSDTMRLDSLPTVRKFSDFEFMWSAAKNLNVDDTAYYDVSLYKLPYGKELGQVMKDTAQYRIAQVKHLYNTKCSDTSLTEKLKVGENYMAVVRLHVNSQWKTTLYNVLNGGNSQPMCFKVIDKNSDEKPVFACAGADTIGIDRKAVMVKVDSLVKDHTELMMGAFPMVMQKATLDNSDTSYSGEGLIYWNPLGMHVVFKVEFTKVKFNKDKNIFAGKATTMEEDEANYLKLNCGLGWTNVIDDVSDYAVEGYDIVAGMLSEKDRKVADYWYNYIQKGARMSNESLRGLFEGKQVLPPVTMPLKVDDHLFGVGADTTHFVLGINDMGFTPTGAVMSMLAVAASPKDNLYIPMVANNICVDYKTIFKDTMDVINLFLLQDVEAELTDGYTMIFKKSTEIGKLDDGCFFSFSNKGFEGMGLDCKLVIGTNDKPGNKLLAVDMEHDGMVKNDKPVSASFFVKIKEWDNWVARINMDPFTVAGAEDYTFVPTGKGIYYDHSSKETPADIKFPKDYLHQAERDAWQGFYLDRFSLFLPSDISNTFVELSGDTVANKDSMYVYNDGKDSSKYVYSGTRMSIGAHQLLVDKDGISVDILFCNALEASTYKGGGWYFSLDTVGVKFVRNDYKDGFIKGLIGVPLIGGKMKYDLDISTDSIYFNISPKDSLTMKIFAANLNLDGKSTYFHIIHDFGNGNLHAQSSTGGVGMSQTATTRVDLTLNGKLGINFRKFKIPVDFVWLKFEDMYIRNFKSEKQKVGKDSVLVYDFDKLDMSIGHWSKASPQKYVGCTPSNGMGVYEEGNCVDSRLEGAPSDDTKEDKAMFSGTIGGFKYSVTSITPILKKASKAGYKQAGVIFGGTVALGIGSGMTVGGSVGFGVWCDVKLDNFDVENFGGQFDSARIVTDLGPVKVDGFVRHTSDDPTYGNGWFGSLMVKITTVEVAMAGGFGHLTTGGPNNGGYDWWYLEGAFSSRTGIPCGAVNITGLGGGFAYNMEPTKGVAQSAKELRKGKDGGSFTGNMVNSTGLAFKPSYDSWMARMGVAIALPETPEAFNADGILTLRVAKGHFSGISLQVNAHILSPYDKTEGEPKEGNKAVINVRSLIDYTRIDDTEFELTFAACVKSEIDISSLLKDKTPEMVGTLITLDSIGSSFSSTENTAKKDEKFDDGKVQNKEKTSKNGVSIKMSVQIPIEFYAHSMKNGKKVDWYFAIGRPAFEDRARFEFNANLAVCKTSTTWSMYTMMGNKFPEGYSMPEIPTKVQEMLGSKYEKAKNKLKGLNFADVGGLALGMTFEAHVEFDAILFVQIDAWLGFDAALLYVKNQSCEGYSRIGKNDFYGMGQVYGALSGSAGLSLNLGFWKGRLTLVEADIAALLQGGGPNPTWCYGLLNFRCSCLNGLVKINTNVDFELGHVCIPGTSDPLANVHLFEQVIPGFASEAEAMTEKNRVPPISMGMLVSNLPWNQDVLLSAQDKKGNVHDRKFRFIMDNGMDKRGYTVNNPFLVKTENSSTWEKAQMKFSRSSDDASTLFFETTEGGFDSRSSYQLHLCARALEYRPTKGLDITNSTDPYFDLYIYSDPNATYEEKTNAAYANYAMWRNPTYFDNGKTSWKRWRQDTVIFFATQKTPDNLNNQVLYTWPYNGDPMVPRNELYTEGGRAKAMIFIAKHNDILDNKYNQSIGKEMCAFLVEDGINVNCKAYECGYRYNRNSGSYPYIEITLPDDFLSKTTKYSDKLAVRLMYIDKNKYQNTLDALNKQTSNMLVDTRTTQELQERDVAALRAKLAAKKKASGRNFKGSVISGKVGGKALGGSTSIANGPALKNPTGNNTHITNDKTSRQTTNTESSALLGGIANKGGTTLVMSQGVNKTKTSQTAKNNTSRGRRHNGTTSTRTKRMTTENNKNSAREDSSRDPELVQLQEAVAAYDSIADTAMLTTRKQKTSTYTIAMKTGNPVYSLFFRLTAGYDTYEDLFKDHNCYFQTYLMSGSKNVTHTSESIEHWMTFNDGNNLDSRNAYLFAPWEPNDETKYMKGVVLPPILYMAIDLSKSQNLATALYQIYAKEYMEMDQALKRTTIPNKIPKQNRKATPDKFYTDKWFTRNDFVDPSQCRIVEANFRNGFQPVASTTIPGLEYTLRMNYSNNYQNIEGATENYKPKLFNAEQYEGPNILQVALSDDKKRYDSVYWATGRNNATLSSTPEYSYSPKVTVLNYAVPALIKNVKLYHDFFQSIVDASVKLHAPGYSHKEGHWRDKYSASGYLTMVSVDGFHHSMPISALHAWYQAAWSKQWQLRCNGTVTWKQTISPETMGGYADQSTYWMRYAIRYRYLAGKESNTSGMLNDQLFKLSSKKNTDNWGFCRSSWFTTYKNKPIAADQSYGNIKPTGVDPEQHTIGSDYIKFNVNVYQLKMNNVGPSTLATIARRIMERCTKTEKIGKPMVFVNKRLDIPHNSIYGDYNVFLSTDLKKTLNSSKGLKARNSSDSDTFD